jgi:hypothetical protein
MGEIADMMLEGEMCAMCGVFLHDGEEDGYPRYCSITCAMNAGFSEEDAPAVCEGFITGGKEAVTK